MNKKIYFIGIGGTAMGNIACMLKSNGYDVCGSDNKIYPPMSDVLISHDITAFVGFNEENIISSNPYLVIVGNVISRGNPEFEWLLESKKFPFVSLAEFIGRELLHDKFNIVVSGTHGKTTTTTLVTHLFRQSGIDNSYMIGGVPVGSCVGSHFGKDKVFVIEGDEYDTALFDKRSKFIHYSPNILIINNIEFDHADIFSNLDDVKRAFFNVLKILPRNGYAVVNGDDPNVLDVIKNVNWTNIIKIGVGDANDFIICKRVFNEHGSNFTLFDKKNNKKTSISTPLFGEYNCRNTALATVAFGLFFDKNCPLSAFKSQYFDCFCGIKRRQEEKFRSSKIMVIDDFGHHPTAIAKTIDAIKEKFPTRKLFVCFEPRSHTARTDALKNNFEKCFNKVDSVLFGNVFKKQNFTHFNELNIHDLCKKLQKQNINASVFESNDKLLESLCRTCSTTECPIAIVFFSNGAFDSIPTKLVEFLKAI